MLPRQRIVQFQLLSQIGSLDAFDKISNEIDNGIQINQINTLMTTAAAVYSENCRDPPEGHAKRRVKGSLVLLYRFAEKEDGLKAGSSWYAAWLRAR